MYHIILSSIALVCANMDDSTNNQATPTQTETQSERSYSKYATDWDDPDYRAQQVMLGGND